MRNHLWIVCKDSTLKSPGAFTSPVAPAFAGVSMLVCAAGRKEREKKQGWGRGVSQVFLYENHICNFKVLLAFFVWRELITSWSRR